MSEIRPGDRVEAYYNLHKLCLSYRLMGGRVQHTEALRLYGVTFAVQPAGHARVLREKRKTVHAFIRGEFVAADPEMYAPRGDGFVVVRYNPYERDCFYRTDTGARVVAAKEVIVIGKTIYARL